MGSPPMNLLHCQLRAGSDRVEVHFGEQVIELPLGYVDSHDLPSAGSSVVLGVRPEDVVITDAGVANTIKARVERSEALGSEILVHLSHADALDTSLSA